MVKSVNCLIVDDEPIAREILLRHLQKIKAINVVDNCKNAVEAFNAINSNAIDLIFLDINMPEVSGLSFARSINNNIKVIFTTAYREYAIDGFELQAVDYLLKPISFERLLQAVNKYLNETVPIKEEKIEEIVLEKSEFVFVRSERKMVKIEFSEISFIESLSDYLKIHFNNRTVVTRETISNIEAKLPQKEFVRIHRSYIVSVSKIESFTNEFVEINKKALPISRSYKKEVLDRLENV